MPAYVGVLGRDRIHTLADLHPRLCGLLSRLCKADHVDRTKSTFACATGDRRDIT